MSVSAQTVYSAKTAGVCSDGSAEERTLRRVLLVDEQAHVLRVIRLNLERCGYLVDAVMSADLAMQQVRTHQYDALILTSDLPDMTSTQLCERTWTLLGDHSPDCARPLILVGRDAGDEWPQELEGREALCRPVSLKLILVRLGLLFESVEKDAGESL